MARTKCPHCEGSLFEVKEISPSGAAYVSLFIQCSGCGAPVTAQEYFNISALMENQKEQIAELSRKVDQLDHNVRTIHQALQQMSRR